MRQFLINEFGQNSGNKIYDLQQKKLKKLLELSNGKSKSQMKTLKKTILPRVSLYKVLQEELGDSRKAYDTVKKYMFNIIGSKIKKLYSKFEIMPGFFYIFRNIMAGTINRGDDWSAEFIKEDKTSLAYNIKKCLWYDACVENDCSELCKIFCDTDQVIYGSMKKVRFIRTKTLGAGDKCCDFCFLNKKIMP